MDQNRPGRRQLRNMLAPFRKASWAVMRPYVVSMLSALEAKLISTEARLEEMLAMQSQRIDNKFLEMSQNLAQSLKQSRSFELDSQLARIKRLETKVQDLEFALEKNQAFIKSSFTNEAVRAELLAVTELVKSVDGRLEKIELEISELQR